MTTFNVDTTSSLNTAISHAHNGDTILLAPGTYVNETLNHVDFSGTVTISSLNPADQAVISDLRVLYSSGLAFSNLVLTGSRDSYAQSRVTGSHNIAFTNMTVHGDVNAAPGSQLSGIYVAGGSGVSITHSFFYNLDSGIVENNSRSLVDSFNGFHDLSKGGIEMGGVNTVVISDNSFTDFHAAVGVHSDAIQIYQGPAFGASNNLKINNNLIDRGSGSVMMGVLLGSESRLPDHNVQITGNAVIGGNWNSISISNASGQVDVANNVTASWAGYDNVAHRTVNYIGRISLGNMSAATLTLTGNSAQAFLNSTGRSFDPGPHNTVLGAVADNGAALLHAWGAQHPDMLPSMGVDLLHLLGVSPAHAGGGFSV